MALDNEAIFKKGAMVINNSIIPTEIDNEFKINSRSFFEKQGALLQVSELATELPTFEFANGKEEFDAFLKRNDFLSIIQQLEKFLFTKGIWALGIQNNKKVVLAQVVDYETNDDNELVYLQINTGKLSNGVDEYNTFTTYDLLNNKGYVEKSIIDKNGKRQPLSSLLGKRYKQEIFKDNFIPFVIFKNNSTGQAEMDLIDQELFALLDIKLSALYFDSFLSAPIPLINWDLGNSKSNSVSKSLFSLGKDRIIQTHSIAPYSDQMVKPFEIAQSQSTALSTIQSIESIMYWIKQALIFKKDSTDGGTHNIHSVEAQQLNSSYNHYIEGKANLREIYYEKFARLVLRVLGLDYLQDINVITTSSSKYLEQQAKILSTDQNGVLLNRNQDIHQTKTNEVSDELQQ
ncbi:hypothetical protein [Mycoplasma sp. 4404]|uniref:hypothetical protein n=1 Tax=Mycoplasma sp. 4404 TaxID=3108530 RepID=UPI002B1D9698|nr:hypothetical protein [Mycoplasma sp. 4404]MEA4162527.1 hypothetical protein [Mycoplasma sp. 4404]